MEVVYSSLQNDLSVEHQINKADYANVNDPNATSSFTNNFLTERHADKLFSEKYNDFPLYEEPKNGFNNTYRDILKTTVERGPVSDIFFSDLNLKHLKRLMCKLVYERSGNLYQIDPDSQSDNEMLTIMRAYYLQNSKNLPNNIKEQVAELNLKVILDVVPRVLSKVKFELSYQRDHGSLPLPLPGPQNVSNAGTRSNRSVTDLFI